MAESFLKNDALWMSIALYGSIILSIFWETVLPRRQLFRPTWVRWINNTGFWLLNLTLQRWLFAGIVLLISVYSERQGWGLLRIFEMPQVANIVISIVLLDLLNTLKHRLFHEIPLLWRLHTLHHSDVDCDVSTTFRHHPFDYLLDSQLSLLIIVAVGASPQALLIFILIVFSHNTFRHANIFIPESIDKVLRLFIVTPDFHRVHHSSVETETNSNYGGIFPWWDWIMRTYCALPAGGQQEFKIGLQYFRTKEELWLPAMLSQPFRLPGSRRARDGALK